MSAIFKGGIFYGDSRALEPFNSSTNVRNPDTARGQLDLDWFTILRGYGGGRFLAPISYFAGKSVWTTSRVITGYYPIVNPAPFDDRGETAAMWEVIDATQYRDLFTPSFMSKVCPD
jgi:hypothetical protein